ncbi:MAG: malate synthase A [Bacteroidetes bacterium]|nr:malate synthase A [Bacteroidota bacterium]
MGYHLPSGVQVLGAYTPEFAEILTTEALSFVADLHRNFNKRRIALLACREERQQNLDNGKLPDFLPETSAIRTGDWKCAPQPADLQDRRVEITGPVDRKMVINALNSGAKMFMADFEDSNSPTWENCIGGQINMKDAVRKTIAFEDPARGKSYKLNDEIATLLVRPRGWHMTEKNILVDGEPICASLLDFGLYFFHNAEERVKRGTGPYYYLPKMESHLEARLWNDAFILAQSKLDLPLGTIKATVLIETILASFELNEILFELRDHSSGLNCGRWDYIFSYIKRLSSNKQFLVPNRAQVGMTVHFMKSYSELVVQTCHKRGVHAMGGMAAQIPIKNDPEANEKALEKVRMDKEREAKAGHDGTWVAHPALVKIAMDEFDQYMPTPNQLHVMREDVNVQAEDLLKAPQGTITLDGIKTNIDVGIQYLEAWLRGNGCVPIYNLMEDAATAEISRTQVWQWLNNENAKLETGEAITKDLVESLIPGQLDKIKALVGNDHYEHGKFQEAAELFRDLIFNEKLEEFLTIKAYEQI